MVTIARSTSVRGAAGSRPKARKRALRPWIETLERREMLDGGLPASITVGRVQSSYTVGGIQNNSLSITYTVYNEEAIEISGVLLTTTLQPGVTFQSATLTPDRNGQELAWGLGTLGPYERASVTVTVSLPASTPSQVDGGAAAYATFDARMVSDTTPAVALRAANIDASLLASTPDANTTDPFVQQKAAELDYDPNRIFAFLRDDVGYESYTGSLRGARGTLWSSAGNALDEASLGVALYRASGIPARYAQGTLSDALAQQLILSMFPAPLQLVGAFAPGTDVADPANDPGLLAEARAHYWAQFDVGGGFQNSDTTFANATSGQTFTALAGTFAEVPDALRHKTTVRLDAEITNTATALFGIPGQAVTTVLEMTYNDVDLVGRPLTFGNFVERSGLGAIFSLVRDTYTPYVLRGDLAFPDASADELDLGQVYQQALTNFPLGSQVLTGLFLEVDLRKPNGDVESYDRPLLDLIGFAARQNGGGGGLNIDPLGLPALTDSDVFTLNVLPGLFDPRTTPPLERMIDQDRARIQELPEGDLGTESLQLQARVLRNSTRLLAGRFLELSDFTTDRLAELSVVKGYFDQPRLVLVASRVRAGADGGPPGVGFEIDLRRETLRALAAPGQSFIAVPAFNYMRGVGETLNEGVVIAGTVPDGQEEFVVNTQNVFEAAANQGVQRVLLAPADLAVLNTAIIASPAALARITIALQAGKTVLVPERPVQLGDIETTAWYEIDPETGETIGVLEDGSHGTSLVEFAAILGITAIFISGLVVRFKIDELPAKDRDKVKKRIADGQTVLIGIIVGGGTIGGLDNGIKAFQVARVSGGFGAGLLRAFGALALSEEVALASLAGAGLAVFAGGYALGGLIDGKDPTAGLQYYDPSPDDSTANEAEVARSLTAVLAGGPVAGTTQVESLAATGALTAAWNGGSTNRFQVRALNAANATVRDENGAVVGTGPVDLDVLGGATVPVAISGTLAYSVSGVGALSFYSSATTNLGVSGEWDDYSAGITGDASLVLTTAALRLNGTALPAGRYTISTNQADLEGSGTNTAPDFAGSATLTTGGATILLGPGTGAVNVGGSALDARDGLTLSGFAGTASIAAGANADTVTLQGSASSVARVVAPAAGLTADQNTPVQFAFDARTSLAGEYALTAEAPAGWRVVIGDDGMVSVTPAPGLQGGTFTVRLTARSVAQPELVAQAEVQVTVTPTAPGISLSVDPDPRFSVPFKGAQVPTAFTATIRNLGPNDETVQITLPDAPPGFTAHLSRSSVSVPAGATAVVGIYFEPVGALPAPGSVFSFDVIAQSQADPGLMAIETESFTVPEIHGYQLTVDPPVLTTTPGTPLTATVTVESVGNVAEGSIVLSADLPAGVTLSGFPTGVALAAGEAKSFTITVTPETSIPLGSTLRIGLESDGGPSGGQFSSQVYELVVRVAVPGADAITDASIAASQIGNDGLAARLNDLSVALTNLVQVPGDAVAKSQALAALDSVIAQISTDPNLSSLVGDLTSARGQLDAATTAPDVQAATTALGAVLDDVATLLAELGRHRFELSFLTNSQVAQPNTPATFGLTLRNLGSQTTTYVFSLEGLSPGLSGQFSQDRITLAPGEVTTAINVTLTPDAMADFTAPLSFLVRATAEEAPGVTGTASGTFTTRDEFVSIVSVNTDPPFIDPGGTVNVSARVLNAVNREQAVSATFVVRDASGQVVFTSAPVSVTLGVVTSIATVELGAFDTSGLALGNYTIEVHLTDAMAQAVPGGTGQGSLLVGSPVTGSLTVDQDLLPPGTSTVTNTLTLEAQALLVGPLGIVSQTDIPGAAGVVRFGNVLYASGTSGIRAFNIANPSAPELLTTFGTAAEVLEVHDDKLYAITRFGPGNRFYLRIYSLADPSNPQLLGNAKFLDGAEGIPYGLAWHMVVTDTHVFVSLWGFTFLQPNDIKFQIGEIISIDVTDPTAPVFVSALRNTYGTNNDGIGQYLNVDNSGGEGPMWEIVQVDPTTLLVAGSTVMGDDTQDGEGVVHVLDVSDPAHMQIVRSLVIPGTVQAVGLSTEGDRAFVTASVGGWEDKGTLDLTGNTVLAVLDISDPRNPALLGSQTIDRPSRSAPDLFTASLGDGLFVFSSRYETPTEEGPALFVVDTNDPQNLVFSNSTIPAFTTALDGEGNFVYTTSSSGLIIHQLDAPDAIPTTARVNVPRNTGVSIVPGSFSLEPTEIIPGADFDTYVWDVLLTSSTRTITWQTTVTDLAPGESRPVALGGDVTFTSQGAEGNFDLPPLEVAGLHLLGLDPGSQTAQPGASAGYTLKVANPTDAPVTYSLAIVGVNPAWSSLPASVTVPADGNVDVPFTLTSEALAALAAYGFTITASAATGARDQVQGTLTLEGAAVFPNTDSRGIEVTLIPNQATAGRGTAASFVARVTNTGSADENFALDFILPDGVTVEVDPFSDLAPPGASNFREVSFRLVPGPGAALGNLPFQVRAALTDDATILDTADGTLNVVANGVDVELDRAAVPPGGTVQATITNTGSVADTFDLTLTGPGGLFGTLGSSQVVLEPGASVTVPVTIAAITGALPGGLPLSVVATSRGNTAVKDGATASITIATLAGLETEFDPDVQIIPVPGTATFLLFVHNMGNAQDQYTATITGTTGPIAAALMGLDGQPTQTIDSFILPALGSGTLVLEADLGVIGQGTATVQVTSLLNGSRTSIQTALLATLVATTTTVSATPNPADTDDTVTLSAIVATNGAGDSPTGTITFSIDGEDQPAVPVTTINGQPGAQLPVTGLAVGDHTIVATYNGDATHDPSTSTPTTLVVNPIDGPRIIDVVRHGYHAQPTTIVLTFDRPMDATRAQDPSNYTIFGPGGRRIRVSWAVYDAATNRVAIRPTQLINVHYNYTLVVNGMAPRGLTSNLGSLLDGDRDGLPGGNFRKFINFGTLSFQPAPAFARAPRRVPTPRPTNPRPGPRPRSHLSTPRTTESSAPHLIRRPSLLAAHRRRI